MTQVNEGPWGHLSVPGFNQCFAGIWPSNYLGAHPVLLVDSCCMGGEPSSFCSLSGQRVDAGNSILSMVVGEGDDFRHSRSDVCAIE